MNILIDMNLSPEWCKVFADVGWEAYHWSTIGDMRAPDHTLMKWALEHDCIVFTHDLDFGALLAATNASGPSVIQVRTQDIMPSAIGTIVISAISAHQSELLAGAILTVDLSKKKIRLLPMRSE